MFRIPEEREEKAPVTYSLRGVGRSSDRYYRDVAILADEMLQLRAKTIEAMLERYMEWIAAEEREPLRNELEYTYDILTLGVLWRLYGGRAQHVPLPVASVLCGLYRLRRRFPKVKRWIDPLRGVLASRFLSGSDSSDHGDHTPCAFSLHKLLLWMDATGEYREEVRRLHTIIDYLTALDAFEREWHLENALQYADSFFDSAARRLGEYTAWVNDWRRHSAPAHRNREDYLLCDRKREEYHLSMLGAELMNRSFLRRYRETGARAVLLPACLRGEHAVHCKARKENLDMICTGCTPECRVQRIRALAAAQGATVHIIPHSSDFSRWLRSWARGKDVGVVGVACVLHLITGGLELRDLDIPAQCVLLDHCGCTQHWDPEGRQTELNEKTLSVMLGVS
ncbi:MAG: DUF116 domain-containing protein [Bacteroidia bacterium]|nr:DUF116 domain-containing protein [Bacteroidia bacterium]